MKQEVLDQIFEEVLNIPIVEVFEQYGYKVTRRCGSALQMPSPFRNDGNFTSFTISESKNIFKDWTLNICGNSIVFVSKLFNIKYFDACIKIAKDFNIIDEETYNNMSKKKVRDIVITKYMTMKPAIVENKIADAETLDKVFRLFISLCTLSKEHKEHLMTSRNLSEEIIVEHMFFTFPTRAIVRKFNKLVEETFGSKEPLKEVPGFFKRKSENNFTFNTFKGIGIPIFNENHQIIGIQVRLDETTGNRYLWFSSGAIKEDCEFGTSSGSPIDVVYPKELKYKGIFITEGKFKALKLAEKFNCIAISVQGVSTWKPIIPLLTRICNSVNKNYPTFNGNWKIQMVYSAFDADLCENYAVYKQLKNMTTEILDKTEENAKGAKFAIKYLSWDINKGKGIDDLINNIEVDINKELLRYDKEVFDTAYEKFIVKVCAEEGFTFDSEVITKLNKEQFLNYYNKYFKVE